MKLVELAYFTQDVAAMRAFYETLFGESPVAESADMAIFMHNGVKLFIHKIYPLEAGALAPENHSAYEVANVDETCQSLARQGLSIEIASADYYWGRSAYLRDPDGHLIEINQPQDA